MKLLVTETFEKLNRFIDQGFKYVIMQGSSSSGKTYAALQTLILLALKSEKPIKIIVVRKTKVVAERAMFGESGDFCAILTSMGLWDEAKLNKTKLTYQLGRAEFIFFGLDNASGRDSARGMKPDIVFLNECDQLDFDIVKQIAIRVRHLMIVDFNPSVSENHFIYTWLCKQVDADGKLKAHRFISTFKDNQFAAPESVNTIKSFEPTEENIKRGTADIQYWRIFGLGERCALDGLIFPETKRIVVDEWPKDVETAAYGMDFGFSDKGDPTTLIRIGFGKKEKLGRLYMEEKLYKKGLYVRHNPNDPKNGSIEFEFRDLGIAKDALIIADSEDPLAIKEIKSLGYNIIPAEKGRGSVKDGIEQMRKFVFYLVSPSTNLQTELNRYKWRTTKDGIQLGEPVKGYDHLIDPARYVVKHYNELAGFQESSGVQMETLRFMNGTEKWETNNSYDERGRPVTYGNIYLDM